MARRSFAEGRVRTPPSPSAASRQAPPTTSLGEGRRSARARRPRGHRPFGAASGDHGAGHLSVTAPLLPLQLPAAAIRSVPGPRPSSSVGKEAGAGGKWPVLGDRGWWQELSDPWLSHLRKGPTATVRPA